jgi:hypothetical protein
MGDPKRTAEGNAGAFLGPDMGGGGGMIPVPMNVLSSGAGEPGPEDEWKIPSPAEGEPGVPEATAPEPAPASHAGLLHRLTHRG